LLQPQKRRPLRSFSNSILPEYEGLPARTTSRDGGGVPEEQRTAAAILKAGEFVTRPLGNDRR